MRRRYPDLRIDINILKIEEAIEYLLLGKGECVAISARSTIRRRFRAAGFRRALLHRPRRP